MDTGKTWVCIIQDTYADRVEILGSDDALLPPQIHRTVKHRQQQKKLQHRILNIKMIIFTE
ncbi:MAG: hypothetical protein ACLR15_00950 [Lachnospiraceae bacterium]